MNISAFCRQIVFIFLMILAINGEYCHLPNRHYWADPQYNEGCVIVGCELGTATLGTIQKNFMLQINCEVQFACA